MTTDLLLRRLNSATSVCDWMFNSVAKTDNGNKLSLQGKSTEDAALLYELLHPYLYANNIPFKVATCQRTQNKNMGEQRNKVVTIYIPNEMDVTEVAEQVYSLTMNYKGWYNIKTPTSYQHYAGCVFVGNDRQNGAYVPALKR